MDVFSHFVLPYLLVYAVRRRRGEALAAGIGGFAPDLDAATAVASLAPPLYFLGHRGASHTLLGAPLYALGAFLLLRAPFWRRVLPIHDELRFAPRLVALGVAFSFTHLALDWMTMWGVALLWPWTPERFSANWFFYSVTPMIPFSAYLTWRLARGTQTGRTLRVGGALLLAALVASSAVRYASHPPVEADLVQPNAGEWAWTVFVRTPEGWNASFWSWGRIVGTASYVESIPPDPPAQRALALAREDVEYRSFHLYAGGPEIVRVEPQPEGSFAVTFVDLMVQAQVDRSPWIPFGEDRAALHLLVRDGRVEEIG